MRGFSGAAGRYWVNAMRGVRSEAIRTVLRWQVMATAACAALGAVLAGPHGALSAVLGGLVSFVAGLAFGVVAGSSQVDTGRLEDLGGALLGALKAWAIKIVLIILLSGLVWTAYKSIVVWSFFGTFALTTVLFSGAALVRDEGRDSGQAGR
jgi:ATP synthase protein I